MRATAEELELIEAEIVDADEDGRLPQLADGPRELERRDDVRTAALVAAGGVAAGIATVAAVHVARTGVRRIPIVGKRKSDRGGVVASRSFLIDVHMLGR